MKGHGIMPTPLITGRPALHQPPYADTGQVADVVEQLRGMPGLVSPRVVDALQVKLALAQLGQAFVIQNGDCASNFAANTLNTMRRRVIVSRAMALIIHEATGLVVVEELREGPAKPRTEEWEVIDGRRVLTFRGESVHSWNSEDREPDPYRMLTAYAHTASMLGYLRALGATDIFTAREALLMPMEIGQLKSGYSTAVAQPWVGLRTAQLDGAHIDWASGILNPVAIKVGRATKPKDLAEACRRLNPMKAPGHLTLVTRFGAAHVAEALPNQLAAVIATGIPFLVAADIVHGNTVKVQVGGKEYKTRFIEDILSELEQVHRYLKLAGIPLSGVWAESTGDPVTECLSSTQPLSYLAGNYNTRCDPRLNPDQCIVLAKFIAKLLCS
jgi:3-deoxy-7-phosphoheptulonate synthase